MGVGGTYSWLEIDQDGPRDVPRVVALVVEDIFAIAAFGRKVLEVSVSTDAVLLAELLPELAADFAPPSQPCVVEQCVLPAAQRNWAREREGDILTAIAALAGLDRDYFSMVM